MGSATGSKTKYCCQCGVDLTGKPRMKDHHGRYWCVACGRMDERSKADSSGVTCAGCQETFAAGRMTQLGGAMYCGSCMKKGYNKVSPAGRGPGGLSGMLGGLSGLFDPSRLFGGGDGYQDVARTRKLLILLGILIVLIVVVNILMR